MNTLATVDKDAVSVVSMLEQAKHWLATAVETTGPAEIAAAKTQIVMAETYATELRLSKDIRDDATEMVRRAEYALSKAIAKGQEEGTIRTRGETGVAWDRWNGLQRETTSSTKPAATDFAPHHELRSNGSGIMNLAEVSAKDFEEALAEARQEDNLSRANVVRKVKKEQGPTTRDQRADLIVALANQGYSSRQMPARVGVTEESVRQIARDYDIDIPADRSIGRTRRINSTDVVVNTATALEGLISGIELIEYPDVDPAVASQWVDSLTDSLKKLRRFVDQIKETTQ